MKSTGVVRRIDELGRIVIPKELRKSLRIREGDLLEIAVIEDESIKLSKHSMIESTEMFIKQYLDSLYYASKKDIMIIDNEKVIACCGDFKKDIVSRRIDMRISDLIQKRKPVVFDKGEFVELCDGIIVSDQLIIKPISIYGDVCGACILKSRKLNEVDINLVEVTASFIGKYLES